MADHACFVTIKNKGDKNLVLTDSNARHGEYAKSKAPPKQIDKDTTVHIEIDAVTGFYGAEGGCTYSNGKGEVAIQYSCPVKDDNSGSVSRSDFGEGVTWKGKAGSSNWEEDSVPGSGTPVYMEVTVG